VCGGIVIALRLVCKNDETGRKPVPPHHAAFYGEVSKIIRDVLRETGTALTTKDIALRVMAERGLNVSDPRLTWTVQKRVGASLRNLRARGTVRSEPGMGRNLAWRL
jgi:hypothetical protein